MTVSFKSSPLPTAQDLKAWKAERERVVAEIKNLEFRRENLSRLIAAGEALVPAEHAKTTAPPTDSKPAARQKPAKITRYRPRRAGSWTTVIQSVLADAARGITYEELRDGVGNTHLGDRLRHSDKGFYGAIGKLAKQGQLIRHKGRLYTQEAHKHFMTEVAAGRAIDDEAPKGGQHSPFGEAIKAFLGKHPMGATGGDLRLELRKTPEFAATIERHKSHLYNVLGRLVARGELTRGGGRYFLAPNAASGAMSGASEVTVRH